MAAQPEVDRGDRAEGRLPLDTLVPASILVIAGSFHCYRGVPGEGVLFIAVGVLLVLAELRIIPRPRERTPRLPGAWPALAVSVPLAAIIAVLPFQGVAVAVVVLVIGAAVGAVGWLLPDARLPQTAALRRTGCVWAGLGMATALWELGAYLLGEHRGLEPDHPTLSTLFEPAIADSVSRGLLIAVWLVGGFALLRWSAGRRRRAFEMFRR